MMTAFNQLLVEQMPTWGWTAGALSWKEAVDPSETGSGPDLPRSQVAGCRHAEAGGNTFAQYPVVVLTGYGSIRNAVSPDQAGAVEYLTKPVRLDELEIIIRRGTRQGGTAQPQRVLPAATGIPATGSAGRQFTCHARSLRPDPRPSRPLMRRC